MKKLFFPMLALLTISMASCTNGDEPIDNGNNDLVEIKATAGIAEILTKAGAGELTAFNATSVGIYGVKEGEVADAYAWTATPYYKSTTSTISPDAVTFNGKLYYPTDDKKVKLFAYLPVEGGTITEPTNNAAPTVSYTLDGKTDILYSSVEAGNLSAHSTVDLKFAHKLAKLSFIVKADASFPANVSVTKITVKGINNDATLNLDEGELTFGSEATGTIEAFTGTQTIQTTASDSFGSVLIQPGQAFGLEIVADGVTYTIDNVAAIAANTAHVLTLTFKPTEVSGTASIEPWTESQGGADVKK